VTSCESSMVLLAARVVWVFVVSSGSGDERGERKEGEEEERKEEGAI
jgi:hypothetical protein